MKNTFFGIFVFAFLTVILLVPGGAAKAADPSVSSFSVSPSSVSSGQPVNISWTLENAGGHSLLFSCEQAVVIRNMNGNTLPCGTKTSVSAQASDATTVTISNVSGALRQLTVTLIPKDGAGDDYSAAQQTASVTIGANQNPITSFTVATSTPSSATTTISWASGTDVPAANLIIGCVTNDISASALSLGTQFLPCGAVISSTGLPASGSLELLFTNQSPLDVSIPLTIVPAIVSGSYDATHGKTFSILVRGMKTIEPIIVSLTASPDKILSGGTSVLSWTTENASGVNIKFNCNEYLSAAKIENQATTTVACGNFIFNQPITGTSATVSVTNMTNSNQTVTASILPAIGNGVYSGVQQKNVNITVLGIGITSLPPTVQTPATNQTQASVTAGATSIAGCMPGYRFSTLTGQACPANIASVPAPSTNETQYSVATTASKKTTFTKSLTIGSRGADVTFLQQFFANQPEIYGSGVLVTGYFGPLTEALVKKFQEKYDIAAKGNPGYGYVGPKTRAKLNSVQ
jgi:peptidoglycan hydrolase-like protein with peptidoglycan-binding domain